MNPVRHLLSLSTVLLCLLGGEAYALEDWLVWDFEHNTSYGPAKAFIITATTPDGLDLMQWSVPPSSHGQCDSVRPGPDTFCARLPACPPPGVMAFLVQAWWKDDEVSERSDPILLCLFTQEQPCACQNPEAYQPPANAGPVVVPPLADTEIPPIQVVELPPLPAFAPVFPAGAT